MWSPARFLLRKGGCGMFLNPGVLGNQWRAIQRDGWVAEALAEGYIARLYSAAALPGELGVVPADFTFIDNTTLVANSVDASVFFPYLNDDGSFGARTNLLGFSVRALPIAKTAIGIALLNLTETDLIAYADLQDPWPANTEGESAVWSLESGFSPNYEFTAKQVSPP